MDHRPGAEPGPIHAHHRRRRADRSSCGTAGGAEKKRWQVQGLGMGRGVVTRSSSRPSSPSAMPLVFDAGAARRREALGRRHRHRGARPDARISKTCRSRPRPTLHDGKVVAIGRGGEAEGPNGKVFLLDPATGKKLRELTPGHRPASPISASTPTASTWPPPAATPLVRIWNIADGKMVAELGKPRGGQFKDWIHAISFSPDGAGSPPRTWPGSSTCGNLAGEGFIGRCMKLGRFGSVVRPRACTGAGRGSVKNCVTG